VSVRNQSRPFTLGGQRVWHRSETFTGQAIRLGEATHLHFKIVVSVMVCGMLAVIFAAQASAQNFYGARDAQYVTSSKNSAVIQYIVCLEDAVGSMARNVSIPDALAGAEKSCQRWARRLPNARGEPNAEDIRQSILECGFRPGDASPDAGCGKVTNSGNKNATSIGSAATPAIRTANSDQVVLTPTVIEIGEWAHGIAFDGKWLWAAESGQRTIAKIDLATGKVAERIKVGRLPTDIVSTGDGNVFALVATEKFIWNQTGGTRRRTLTRFTGCPEAMIDDGQDLWALTLPDCVSDKSRVIRIDPHSGRQTKSSILGKNATALASQGTQIWVAHGSEPALTLVDRTSLKATPINAGGASFWSITSNSRNVFAGGRVDGTANDGLIVMFDPVTLTRLHRASLPQRIAEIISDEDHVVAVGDKGGIWVFSARDLTLQRTITLSTGGLEPRAVMFNEDALLISSSRYRGENGAVFVIGNWRPEVQQTGAPDPVAPDPGQRISPSFDCATANSAAERVICANNQLASLDRALGAEYKMAIRNITSPAVGGGVSDVLAFKKEQRAWLRDRDECRGDEDCLFSAYQTRLRVIEKLNKAE